MSNKLKLHTVIGLSVLMIPGIALADTPPTSEPATAPAATAPAAPAATTQEMAKDEWLGKIKAAVSEPICKGFMDDQSIAARMKERGISFEKCVGMIPAITDKCKDKYYNDIPAKINMDMAAKWGHTLGECIGGDFAVNYLYSEPAGSTSTSSTSTTTTTTTPASAAPATPAPAPTAPKS